MPLITVLEPQKRRSSRLNLYLDGQFAFGLSQSLAAEARLEPGKKLSQQEVEALRVQAQLDDAYQAALHFLSYRPRSQAEIRQRLRRHFPPATIEAVLERLEAQGLADDAAFAQFWQENRQRFRPRGKGLLRAELRQKGVADQTIAQTLEAVDEEAAAQASAEKQLPRLDGLDRTQFRRRLSSHLRRRGFSWEVVGSTLAWAWERLTMPAAQG